MDEVLILHASCGGGHAAAARALARAFEREAPEQRVRVVDALEGMTPGFRSLYTRSFELSVAHTPSVYGAFFQLSRNVDRSPVLRAARSLSNRSHGRALIGLLRRARPRAVVCTHYLPLEIALREQQAGRLQAPVYAVVTDYVAHGLWRQPGAERTFCAPGRARHDLRRGGVPARRIVPCGIPVDPSYGAPYDLRDAKARTGLALERPTAVLLAGAAGMGPLVSVLRRTALATGGAADLVVVCGKNEQLRADATRCVRDLPAALGARVRVLGFVSPIGDLLRGADVMVTKPDGLTTSECLTLGKATVFYEAAPGQESANARHAVALGAGALGGDPGGTAAAVASLLRDPHRRERMGAAARRAARPDAARQIVEEVLTRCGRGAAIRAA